MYMYIYVMVHITDYITDLVKRWVMVVRCGDCSVDLYLVTGWRWVVLAEHNLVK